MMGCMTTTTTSSDAPAEQLTLLPAANVPARFLLSRETRERGLRHVAEIRRQLAERQAARDVVEHLAARRPQRPTAA